MGEEKKGFFKRLVSGLTKTRDSIVSSMDSIFNGFSKIDEEFYEELEEVLIMGDLGVQATYAVLDDLRAKVKEQRIKEPMECKQLLIDSIKEQMRVGETAYEFEDRTSVVLVIGVNGVGKTTTIGKLAGKLRANNKKVVLAAADTFRAAAGEQLVEWARRADAELIGGQDGADPAAIVYDAVAAAKARHADVLLCDTAGRLHNKKNLMEELKKINRVLERESERVFWGILDNDIAGLCLIDDKRSTLPPLSRKPIVPSDAFYRLTEKDKPQPSDDEVLLSFATSSHLADMPGTPLPGPVCVEYVLRNGNRSAAFIRRERAYCGVEGDFPWSELVLVRNVKSLEVALYSAKTQFVEDWPSPLPPGAVPEAIRFTLHREEEEQPELFVVPVFPRRSHVRN